MKANYWNRQKQEYEEINISDGAKFYSNDMDEKITCASCEKEMTFGEGYTSFEIQTNGGMGYSVCSDCYENEVKRERLFK